MSHQKQWIEQVDDELRKRIKEIFGETVYNMIIHRDQNGRLIAEFVNVAGAGTSMKAGLTVTGGISTTAKASLNVTGGAGTSEKASLNNDSQDQESRPKE